MCACSGMKAMDPITAIGMSGLGDVDKLTKWIKDSHLDPNDPSNADIMHLLRASTCGDLLCDLGVDSIAILCHRCICNCISRICCAHFFL